MNMAEQLSTWKWREGAVRPVAATSTVWCVVQEFARFNRASRAQGSATETIQTNRRHVKLEQYSILVLFSESILIQITQINITASGVWSVVREYRRVARLFNFIFIVR